MFFHKIFQLGSMKYCENFYNKNNAVEEFQDYFLLK